MVHFKAVSKFYRIKASSIITSAPSINSDSKPAQPSDQNKSSDSKFSLEAKSMETVVARDVDMNKESEVDIVEGDPKDLKQDGGNQKSLGEIADDSIAPKKLKVSEVKSDMVYLNTISAVGRLVSKFLQNMDYLDELRDIDQANLPHDVKQVLDDMERYATSASSYYAEPVRVYPNKGPLSSIIGHFIKVDKISSEASERDAQYDEIKKRLGVLEIYFYSKQFLNETMGHD